MLDVGGSKMNLRPPSPMGQEYLLVFFYKAVVPAGRVGAFYTKRLSATVGGCARFQQSGMPRRGNSFVENGNVHVYAL